MNLDRRYIQEQNSVSDSHAGVGVSGRVDDQALDPSDGLLNGLDNFSLVVGLERGDLEAQFCALACRESLMSFRVRLP
jgi:hypothetical protein